MQVFHYTIRDELGIHARPAGLLVKEAMKFESEVTLSSGDSSEKTGNAKRLFSVMGMAVKCGDRLTVTTEGEDEETASRALLAFLEEHL